LQVQQIRLGAGSSVVTPVLPGLTPPATPVVITPPPTESC